MKRTNNTFAFKATIITTAPNIEACVDLLRKKKYVFGTVGKFMIEPVIQIYEEKK